MPFYEVFSRRAERTNCSFLLIPFFYILLPLFCSVAIRFYCIFAFCIVIGCGCGCATDCCPLGRGCGCRRRGRGSATYCERALYVSVFVVLAICILWPTEAMHVCVCVWLPEKPWKLWKLQISWQHIEKCALALLFFVFI